MTARFLCCVFAVICPSASFAAAPQDERPNILFVMIDDLGWMDLACQGNKLVETPNLDRFAANSMTFTDAYAAAPVCSPTRASIMTGLAPARLQITNHLPDQKRFTPKDATLLAAKTAKQLDLHYVTIAERAKTAGYKTAFMGKWHLGGEPFYPEKQGFDLNIAGCEYGGPPTFFDPYRIPTIKNRQTGEYLPYRLADEVINYLRTNRDNRFLLFLWNYTVHWPMEAPQELLEKYKTRTGPGLNDTRYGAMIEAMDRSIGQIMDELKRLGLEDNTLVVFTSDNGGFGGVADNRPLRAAKGYLYEGGIRVPLFVRWPGVIRRGSRCDVPVISTDFHNTLAEVMGVENSHELPEDGVSLLPLLKEKGKLSRDAIYFHYPNYAWHRSNRLGGAIRSGNFKLIENFEDNSLELYDLKADLSETRDLSESMPDRAQALRAKLANWRQSVGAQMPIEISR